MAHLKEHWFPYLLGIIILFVILKKSLPGNTQEYTPEPVTAKSLIPDIYELSDSAAVIILYGKNLIDSTAKYFGPHGSVAAISNGLNCANCHRESGTKLYTNNFLAVASTYPKYRERSGKLESVEWRVNECMQRSLNGESLDSTNKEMKAMVAYIKWVGKNVTKNMKAEEAGSKELPFLPVAADPAKGEIIYTAKCIACHGKNGEGVMGADSSAYLYPPLWGEHSYVVSAGMFRLSRLASFIQYNMPFGATYKEPQLSNEEAWNVAAYINSQPRPKKMFAGDWPVLRTKPVDYPFGPYADGFSEKQHKYGPFDPIKKAKEMDMKK